MIINLHVGNSHIIMFFNTQRIYNYQQANVNGIKIKLFRF